MRNRSLERFEALAVIPDAARAEWLSNAEECIAFLEENISNDEVLVYASGPHFLIHSVLGLAANFESVDCDALASSWSFRDSTWFIERSWSGAEQHYIRLTAPFESSDCKALEGGEQLVFTRQLHYIDKGPIPLEISQKLVHALNLHFVPERGSYCRLDDRGDIEDVVKILRKDNDSEWKEIRAVSIKARDLQLYLAVSGTVLVSKFDATRAVPGGFGGWGEGTSLSNRSRDLFYNGQVIPGQASYVNGYIIGRPTKSADELAEEWRAQVAPENRKYAAFKVIDHKNGRMIETSCAPSALSNYFQKSDLPWEISPAFFRAEVLHRFKADPEKFKLDDRTISCRNAWTLKTYDINEAGQVHTYIGYLKDLPYEEQLYWQAFNEWPKAGISERAYKTDIMGQWDESYDPMLSLKTKVLKLDSKPPAWWKKRGTKLLDAVRYPATDSITEWGNEILALDQLVIEGLLPIPFRKIIEDNGGEFEKNWGVLKLLEVALTQLGFQPAVAQAIVSPLKELHDLRNPAKAHGSPERRDALVSAARTQHGNLRAHFTHIATKCDDALGRLITDLQP